MTRKLLLMVTFFSGIAVAQQVNPRTQILWPRITGAGTPAATSTVCSAENYGQPYQNTAVNPNTNYVCANQGGTPTWQLLNGGGGITALTSDVTASGSGSVAAIVNGIRGVPFCSGFSPTNGQQLQYTTGGSPNPCYSAATGSGSLSGQTTACAPKAASATTSTSSLPVCDDGTTTTISHPLQVTGSGPPISIPSNKATSPAAGTGQLGTDSSGNVVRSNNGGAQSIVAGYDTFAAPPAVGNTTPAPSIVSNLSRSVASCDPSSPGTLCVPQEREGENCTYNTGFYFCNSQFHVWTDPLLQGTSTGSAGMDNSVESNVYGPGIDTGNCGNCGSAIWSAWRGHNETFELARRGLDGATTDSVNLDRVGDYQHFGFDIDNIAGRHAASDEGVDGIRQVWSEPSFWTGTEPATGSIDQTYVAFAALSSVSGRTTDGTWMTDVTQEVTGGALNGNPSPAGNGYLFSQPVTGLTIAASNWDTCTPGIGQSTGLPRPQTASYTVTCTVQAGSGIATGWAKVGANFGEGVTVTAASAPSAGSQTVTFTANQPQPSGFTIWQNPGSGTSYTGYCGWVNDDFTGTGQKPLFQVFGALDSTHLVLGIQGPGNLNQTAFPNIGNSYETSTSAITLAPCAEIVQNVGVNFTGNLTQGSTSITSVSSTAELVVGQQVYGSGIGPGVVSSGNTRTSITAISGSTVTLSAPATLSIVGAKLSAIAGSVQLEPHAWTIANGDNLEDPHSANPQQEGSVWTHVLWNTPAHDGYDLSSNCDGMYCAGHSYKHLNISSAIPIGKYWGPFYPPDSAADVNSAGHPNEGYFGGGWKMDNAPIPINPSSYFGMIEAMDSTFTVTGTTNGTTTVTVTGFPNPPRMCSMVTGQMITAADIPTGRTVASCTAGSTNTATITLNSAATGSNTNETIRISYPTNVWVVNNSNNAASFQGQLDPSANSGAGKLNLSVAELDVNGSKVLTAASSPITGVVSANTIPRMNSGGTALENSDCTNSGSVNCGVQIGAVGAGGNDAFVGTITNNNFGGVNLDQSGAGGHSISWWARGTAVGSLAGENEMIDHTAGQYAMFAWDALTLNSFGGHLRMNKTLWDCFSSGDPGGSQCDRGFSSDASVAGQIDVDTSALNDKLGGIAAANGVFGTSLKVAGNDVCQSTGTNCPAASAHGQYYWSFPSYGSDGTGLPVSAVYYLPNGLSSVAAAATGRFDGTCTSYPVMTILDLGTSASSTSGTTLLTLTFTTSGVVTTSGTVTVASGHYLGISTTDSIACSVQNDLDVTMTY